MITDLVGVDDRNLSDLIRRMPLRTDLMSSVVNQIIISCCNQRFKLEVRVASGQRAAALPPHHLLPNNPRVFHLGGISSFKFSVLSVELVTH